MDANTGGAAFPSANDVRIGDIGTSGHPGMTLRDYFAAKAMQASRARLSEYGSWADLAKDAYEIADSMLAARGNR